MIKIKEIVNSIFTSKTYILYHEGEDKAWLVDIGDIEPVVAFLEEKKLTAEGVFLTHGHFDHIYGVKNLVDCYPHCKVYATSYCKECLASDKLNMSKYHEQPFTYENENIIVVHEEDGIKLFDDEPSMMIYETPGHNPGCMTMVIGALIFTGDAFIPGVGANTQPPHSDKELAKKSLDRIMDLAKGKTILSGHKV